MTKFHEIVENTPKVLALEPEELAVFLLRFVADAEATNRRHLEIGVKLARKAFRPTTGPLTDSSQVEAEQEALSALIAGALGSYKNPHSHRNITIDEGEAAEMVILASHLLNIIESRRKA